jgi:type I restriction enzyme S subunit
VSLDILFDNFDMLANAPNGINKLREMILQLAVQGRLVPQDPADEPASVLLEKIKTEKEKLIKEGKLKKSKPLPPIRKDEISYELPKGWEWTRLVNIGFINPRNEINDNNEVSFLPMKFIPSKLGEKVKSESRKWKEIKKGFTHFAEGDVAMAKITPCFQNKKSVVMRDLINGAGAGTTELHIFRHINEQVIPEYILLYLKSPKFIEEGISKMTGSAGQKRVPKTYFSQNPFPLPPLKEQQRIVTKVDKLMSLCDELEAKLSKSQVECSKLMESVAASISFN